MTTKKTDWKKEHAKMQEESPEGERVLLQAGKTLSKGNPKPGGYSGVENLKEQMQVLEANRKLHQQLRIMKKKAQSKRPPYDRLKGLFGGGE